MDNKIKLNIGSYSKDVGKDWINLDGLDIDNVDLICDISYQPFVFKIKNDDKIINIEKEIFKKESYTFKSASIDEIQMVEVLEHIDFRKCILLLRELYRILKPTGKIHIQVPDCGKAMEYYVNKQVCQCVPHKPKNDAEAVAEPFCEFCEGKAKINNVRWLLSFLGAQKHKFDYHRNIFTKGKLEHDLKQAKFKNINFVNDPKGWKLICNITK